jgi:hypothetical protein
MRQTAKKINTEDLSIRKIKIGNNKITAEISDGRIVSIPIDWFPPFNSSYAKTASEF